MKSNLTFVITIIIALSALAFGCSPKINVFPNYSEPLREVTLEGSGEAKILVIPITGVIDASPRRGLFFTKPSMVEEVVAMLDQARKDENIKAVILQINSPGGSATASDILNKEIKRYKMDTGAKVVAMMMDLAASGGYYTAVAADSIIAHPTTVTGSIGVVFLTANVEGLFDKVGVETDAIKSGKYKDMGSPFREMTDDERQILQKMIDEMYDRFVYAVKEGRPMLEEQRIRRLADGRIYTAAQALEWKLIDKVGYSKDALAEAKLQAGLRGDVKLIAYRRRIVSNDNIYNTKTTQSPLQPSLINLGIGEDTFIPRTGFYYIWKPGTMR